ncbi:MAG TPA: hypothetical protein VK921_08455 [Anditalea sp.]|nr:hypothetical protein [Anditalea sp.]
MLLTVGCSSKPDFELYEGKNLSIAVLGTEPKIEEEQVNLQEISFEEFTTEELRKYDAVFVTKESFSKAAESQYASTYLDSHIPFFFIESNRGAYPFIDAELAYEDAREMPHTKYYANGFLAISKEEQKTWNYGLYNDEVNEENIKEMFSRIFETIETNPKGSDDS